jgi:hypothetical protein
MVPLNKRGPKEKPEAEKKVAIRIWVKKKHHAKASKEAKTIERKYNSIESNSAVRA